MYLVHIKIEIHYQTNKPVLIAYLIALLFCAAPTCDAGSFKCRAVSYCISNSYQCDGVKQCPFGDDEESCREY